MVKTSESPMAYNDTEKNEQQSRLEQLDAEILRQRQQKVGDQNTFFGFTVPANLRGFVTGGWNLLNTKAQNNFGPKVHGWSEYLVGKTLSSVPDTGTFLKRPKHKWAETLTGLCFSVIAQLPSFRQAQVTVPAWFR
jgi:hypothetical protein